MIDIGSTLLVCPIEIVVHFFYYFWRFYDEEKSSQADARIVK